MLSDLELAASALAPRADWRRMLQPAAVPGTDSMTARMYEASMIMENRAERAADPAVKPVWQLMMTQQIDGMHAILDVISLSHKYVILPLAATVERSISAISHAANLLPPEERGDVVYTARSSLYTAVLDGTCTTVEQVIAVARTMAGNLFQGRIDEWLGKVDSERSTPPDRCVSLIDAIKGAVLILAVFADAVTVFGSLPWPAVLMEIVFLLIAGLCLCAAGLMESIGGGG